MDSHVDSYKEDFDIDKRIIRRAAESPNPEDKTLMWFCRPHGTHCLNENQVFIQASPFSQLHVVRFEMCIRDRKYNAYRIHQSRTEDSAVYDR